MRHLVLCVICALCSGPLWAAELVLQSQYRWTSEDPNFGGLSGLWMSPDGSRLLALSDRGYYARAEVARDEGKITDVPTTELSQLPLVDDRAPEDFLIDAEGLAIAPDGTIYVSYEGHHRVWAFDPDFKDDSQGVVYAIPERSGKWTRPFPVQRYKDEVWDEVLSIPRSKRFLVVGADFGPDGRFYLLERDFDVLSAFKSRIRRFDLTDQGFVAEETLLETSFSVMDNAEGISLWVDNSGRTIVSIISDDNYSGLIRTLLTEYVLIE